MKKRLLYLSVLLIGGVFSTTSCVEKESTDAAYVNSWIAKNMNTYYYWNNKIPANLNNTVAPETFFYSMIYKYDKLLVPDGDRFSWIQENYIELLESLSGVASNEIGFEYKLYLYDNTKVFGEIAYVKKGTDAAAKGLRRGQTFTHVNGTLITTANYKTILSTTSSSVKLHISDPAFNFDTKEIQFNNSDDVLISTQSKYSENPVYLDSVYAVNGKIMGYLVYNFFAADPGDETGVYDIALNNVFAKFKNRNLTDLIIDLRYNSGGSLRSAVYLSSMIVKNLSPTNIFLKTEYNSLVQNEYIKQYGSNSLNDLFTDKVTVYDDNGKIKSQTALNNLENLQTLYILSGNHTASASEMVINGLKPYMEVRIVGDITVGKNVGSVSFYEENNPKNKWGMQPIIAKFHNSAGESDFTSGFVPDVLDRDTWNMPKKALGDMEEALLSKAIASIAGLSPIRPQSAQELSAGNRLKELRSSFDKKSRSNQIIIPAYSIPEIK